MISLIIFGGLVALGLVAWILINTFSREAQGSEGGAENSIGSRIYRPFGLNQSEEVLRRVFGSVEMGAISVHGGEAFNASFFPAPVLCPA